MEEKQEFEDKVEEAVEEVEKEIAETKEAEKVQTEQAMEESEEPELKEVEKSDGKQFTLLISEKELKNPQLKRALANLVSEKLNLQRSNEYMVISQAEVEVMSKLSLFVPVSKFTPKYKNQVGKFRGKAIVVK